MVIAEISDRKAAPSTLLRDSHTALLPAGMPDLLPPFAAQEAAIVERLAAAFAAQGYERVKPPLIEFEATLFAGAGAAMAPQTFRIMDPESPSMLGMRADITPQIARIATTRLVRLPRPLRLSYAGQVVRVRGGQLRSERQFGQVGAELIGVDSTAADTECLVLAVESLVALGVKRLFVDLTLPPLVPLVCQALGFEGTTLARLRRALDAKDIAAVTALAGGQAAPLIGLINSVGPAAAAMETLAALRLPDAAHDVRKRLADLVLGLQAATLPATLTIDPTDRRTNDYEAGIAFTLFADGVRGELGRGGRYVARDGAEVEHGVGFTLYTDTVCQGLPAPDPAPRLFVPMGTAAAAVQKWRALGWITIAALEPLDDAQIIGEARRLSCSHHLSEGQPVAVS